MTEQLSHDPRSSSASTGEGVFEAGIEAAGCGRRPTQFAANIFPTDANILPRPHEQARAELLFASEVGRVVVSDPLSTAYQWYTAAARKLAMAKAGSAMVSGASFLHHLEDGAGSAVKSALGVGKQSRMWLPGPLADSGSDPAFSKRTSETPCTGEWDSESETVFSYGEVSFCLPTRWLERYISLDRATPTEDALDLLWSKFRDRREASDATIAGFLHCWNIGTTHRFDVPWSAFWSDGGPLNFYINALALVEAYSSYIRDDYSGVTSCEGLDDFCAALIQGDRATAKVDDAEGPCDLRVFVRSLDSNYDRFESQNCIAEERGEEPTSCGAGFNSACGPEYDLWLNLPPPEGSTYWYWWVLTPFGLSSDYTQTDCSSGAFMQGGGFGVRLHASQLAYNGFIADFLMWWARCALDYAMEKGSFSHLEASSQLARFVLYRISRWSSSFIHELGHTYVGSGHCDPHKCCFDIAAERWHCKVIAKLGLPRANSVYPKYSSDSTYLNDLHDSTCGEDDDENTPICYKCKIDDYATPESDSDFVAKSCGYGCPEANAPDISILDNCLNPFGCPEELIPVEELPHTGGP